MANNNMIVILYIARAEYKIILSQNEMFEGTDKIAMYM